MPEILQVNSDLPQGDSTGMELVNEFLSSRQIYLLRKVITDVSESDLNLRMAEMVKFLILASLDTGSSTFIPCTNEIDDLWHACILETREYREMCDRLPGKRFVEHKHLPFEEFVEERSTEDMLRSDLEWAASYVANFGPFSAEALPLWIFPQLLMKRMDWSLPELNAYLSTIKDVEIAPKDRY
jgi:hypothetical protein